MLEGYVTLEAPKNSVPTHIWLASGKIASPNKHAQITVPVGDARPLVGAGWRIVEGRV